MQSLAGIKNIVVNFINPTLPWRDEVTNKPVVTV